MNAHEQFDKLAEQCYVKTGSIHTDHFDYVKFAELIVGECVGVVEESRIGPDSGVCPVAITTSNIKQHFGVEE